MVVVVTLNELVDNSRVVSMNIGKWMISEMVIVMVDVMVDMVMVYVFELILVHFLQSRRIWALHKCDGAR